LVMHGYEDIYGITMQDAKIFQSVISPKGDKSRQGKPEALGLRAVS
jgi:hypothetical protein